MSGAFAKKKKTANGEEDEEEEEETKNAAVGWEDLPVVIRVRIRLLAKRKAAADAMAVALQRCTPAPVALRQEHSALHNVMTKVLTLASALGFEPDMPRPEDERHYRRGLWRTNPFNEADGQRLVLLSEYVDINESTLCRAACACSDDLADVMHTPFATELANGTIRRWQTAALAHTDTSWSKYTVSFQWVCASTLLRRKFLL